ncbi:RNA methyltransferase, TrmH family [Clostridium grantii DSM 8605]|uniref:RNA methyltransferase, TrmH family n=1 Tax=Clostridium grantii DSM 8605 TaxID=1121316 RepID=A0A1M5XK36_9CLOT|nr:RNA methyltransferase, TrmH family [Clostridium grantii DSM 8605]
MKIISSKDNSLIKEVKKLNDRKVRLKKKQFFIEGFRFVEEALKSDFIIPYLFISEDNSYKLEEQKANIDSETECYIISDKLMKYICNTENPQGIAAVVNMKEDTSITNEKGFYLLADKVRDPGNMGTIIRTAHATGAHGVILTKGTVDVYNDKTLRSTMGSIFKVNIINDEENEFLEQLKEKGFQLLVSSLEAKESFYQLDLTDKVIIAVGNEGNGISDEILGKANKSFIIPMVGDSESLNVAVAASVMMYEILRQKLN